MFIGQVDYVIRLDLYLEMKRYSFTTAVYTTNKICETLFTLFRGLLLKLCV